MNKVADRKRLLIYLALSFGLTFLWYALAVPWGQTWDELSAERQNLICLSMLFPAAAHLLSRRITGEGFALHGRSSMRLGISFRDRKWIWYLAAFLLPWLCNELGSLMRLLFRRELYDPQYYLTLGIDRNTLLLYPANAMIVGAVGSFGALGEELGWRDYMMPKLLALTGRRRALVIGGILWGLWHAPLTCIGHNFGTSYPGFPYLGILWMSAYCVLFGVILTFLTEKSGSVWPAAILHAVSDAQPGILQGFIDPERGGGSPGLGFSGFLLAAVFILFLWRRQETDDPRRGRCCAD